MASAIQALNVLLPTGYLLSGFLHGMAILEIDGRFPPDADLERSWARGVAGFAAVARGALGASIPTSD